MLRKYEAPLRELYSKYSESRFSKSNIPVLYTNLEAGYPDGLLRRPCSLGIGPYWPFH